MSDSRKYIDEQFDKFFEFDTEDRSTVTSTSCKLFAEHCIQQLLAVIELQRQAISLAKDTFVANKMDVRNVIEVLNYAIKPQDVELVEVAEMRNGEWVSGYFARDLTAKLYKIQMKGK